MINCKSKSQLGWSYKKMTETIIALQELPPSARALQETFIDCDQDHREVIIDELKRTMINFSFMRHFGVGQALELLAIWIAHKEGWRDFGKEGY
jgi:hypothetical protein